MIEQPLVRVAILLGLLLCSLPVTNWFGRTVQTVVLGATGSVTAAVYVYHALVLPGTALHELSHLVSAWLLRVPTGRLSLTPLIDGPGTARFGSVQIAQVDPFRESLIGLAPLLSGVAAIIAVTSGPLGLPDLEMALCDPGSALQALLHAPDVGLWLYLLIAVGNTMLPSRADRRAWLVLPVMVAGLWGVLWLVGGGHVADPTVSWAWRAGEYIAGAMGLTLFVDLMLGGLIHLVMLPFQPANCSSQ